MKRRVHRKKESVWSHTYRYARFRPPLCVIGSVLSRWGPGGNFERTKRQGISVNILTMGDGHYVQEGREGHVQAGDIFVAHRDVYQLLETGPRRLLHKRTLIIEGEALDAVLQSAGLSGVDSVHPSSATHMAGWFRRAHVLLRDKPSGFTSELSCIAYSVLLECGRCVAPDYPLPLRAAIAFVRQNLGRRITLREIAAAAQLSVRHCSRLFHDHTGVAPMAFCISQKMALAENMLLNTTLPVNQVALAVGYEDPFRFSLQFKQHFGRAPKHYREHLTPAAGERYQSRFT